MIRARTKLSYTFGTFRFDLTECVLFNENRRVSLTPKAFDTLLATVQHRGHVLTTEESMAQVWPDSFVEGNNLAQNIFDAEESVRRRRSEIHRDCSEALT